MKVFKYLFIQVIGILTIISCSPSCKQEEIKMEKEHSTVEKKLSVYGFNLSDYREEEGVVKKNQFFALLMRDLGVDAAEAAALTQCAQGVFDLRDMRVGNTYKAYYRSDQEERLAYLVYEQSPMSYVLFCLEDSLHVRRGEYRSRVEWREVSVTIQNSLWADVQKAGAPTMLASKLSDIYAWTIDFFGLQKGDSFTAVYEELIVEDEPVGIRNVLGSIFYHGGREHQAYRFMQDSLPGYWNEKGENLRKAFLKAPLNFTRVSSGFSYARRHPVTRVVRPHTGVDYAAPKGTPVMSIGDGRVIEKGYKGGGGNTVKIKHNSSYTTAYLHLSAYAKGLSVGQHVGQGQVIGYVGSTGLSTGPHLDFRVWKDGKPINPLKMESPSADPLKKENRELFDVHVAVMQQSLDPDYYHKVLDVLLEPLLAEGE